MSEEINSQEAVIIYAKHLEKGRHNPDSDNYAGARRSLERTLAYSLRDFSGDGLVKDAAKLEDFELIGFTDRVLKRDQGAINGFKHGVAGLALTVVAGAAGSASVGWAFGLATFGTLLTGGSAKIAFEAISLQRHEKKMATLVHSVAKERTPVLPTVSERPAPIGLR